MSIRHESASALRTQSGSPEFFTEVRRRRLSDMLQLRQDGDLTGSPTGADGTIRIRFTPHSDFGVMDHWVHVGDEPWSHRPACGWSRTAHWRRGHADASTASPTLSDDDYSSDIKLVSRDLKALKALIER